MGGKKTNGREFPLAQALAVAEKVSKELTDLGIVNVIAGSIRRRKPTVHDVDIVIGWNDAAEKYCLEKFGLQKNKKPKRSGIVDEINVELYPATSQENWITNVASWTGSKEENVRLRRAAQLKGYTLSQTRGLIGADGLVIPLETEMDLYAALDEPYVEPELR